MSQEFSPLSDSLGVDGVFFHNPGGTESYGSSYDKRQEKISHRLSRELEK